MNDKLTNLLDETLEYLSEIKRKPSDVEWVGSMDGEFAISWNDFCDIAKNTNYDSGYGCDHIATDLVIVLSDNSFLMRREYDGAEWWEYIKMPVWRACTKNFSNITGSSNTIKELNADGVE